MRLLMFLLLCCFWNAPAFSEELTNELTPMWPDTVTDEERAKWLTLPGVPDLPEYHNKKTEFTLRRSPTRKRNYFWPALVSIPVPGFGQYYEGQKEWGYAYTGIATASAAMMFHNILADDDDHENETDENAYRRSVYGTRARRAALGQQMYQSMGGLSAYHYFRSAVRSRQPYGEFAFLKKEESMTDILMAPLNFTYMARPTTFLPLTIGAGLYLLLTEEIDKLDDHMRRKHKLNGSDVYFASQFSYNAGVHEEAVFRGWLQPMLHNLYNEPPFLANLTTAGIFALAHVGSTPLPLPQFVLGLHMGWVTERNQWTIGESIFIHVWWDVIAFIGQYQLVYKEDPENRKMPALHFPPFEYNF